MQRRFAIVGHRAVSSGRLPLDDLTGAGGRMDVLCRAISSSLFLSHGIRSDTHVTLHLMGGPGPPRRIWIDGASVRGLRPDERAIAGVIAKVLREPAPPAGHLREEMPGVWHDAGDLSTTLDEWRRESVTMVTLDADSPPLRIQEAGIRARALPDSIGFFLSDDRPFDEEEASSLSQLTMRRSLGAIWLQGHQAIAVAHHLLDEGVPLDIG